LETVAEETSCSGSSLLVWRSSTPSSTVLDIERDDFPTRVEPFVVLQGRDPDLGLSGIRAMHRFGVVTEGLLREALWVARRLRALCPVTLDFR
jgi:hypothetical protein